VLAADIHDPTECECGRPKFAGNEACSSCASLDGSCWSEARIISTLRIGAWMTLREMGAMINSTGNALQRPVAALFDSGRLIRQWRESDTVEAIGRGRYGGRHRMALGGGGSWEYSLARTKRRAA
jgi:hypothetical protein